ncbi:hypothetical protein SIAM614_20670 [Stappia aggregata IAM 12614]|uniref:Uncharacterized protein n=1 Tax=Roseibium aggregatum (strain ATCC 25650 / DSM 13394 / JCM 20685 / NBRC 16684 / NCIMB 2208 / IAM 12614 / B1) TaxID=384765 RepID=A0NYE5_ROSAI|nr:hypothetical protein [Roseibium aggregatum]EAV42141.1 hypothetical protein SIAM614_20670 [Stappia aggregata IAM 12614] [Roseibium aggregatum IAM 12614]
MLSFNVSVDVHGGDGEESGPATIGWLLAENESRLIYKPPQRLKQPSPSRPRTHAKSVTACPAVLGLESRLFEVQCPCDLTLRMAETDFGEPAVVNADGPMSTVRDDVFANLIILHPREEWRDPGRPILQMRLPYIFIADEPTYMSQLPPFQHLRKTPLPGLMIPGRFPINVWPRTLTWAFEWHDISAPLELRRGDPLFYVLFEVLPQSRAIQLVEAERTPELEAYLQQINGVVGFVNQTFSLFRAAEELRPAHLVQPKKKP